MGNIVITPHMTAEEKQAAIKLANEADPGPSITSWRYFKFLITAFLVILNSGDNGTLLFITLSFGLVMSGRADSRIRWYGHELGQFDGTISNLLWSVGTLSRRYFSCLCRSSRASSSVPGRY